MKTKSLKANWYQKKNPTFPNPPGQNNMRGYAFTAPFYPRFHCAPPEFRKQSGNALFLILIAVALFAALAYAVTQSSRDGGGLTREQLQIDVALVLQQAAMIEAANTRLLLATNVPQVKFRTNSYATGDMSYWNRYEMPDGTTVTNIYTIGMFNAQDGMPPPIVPISLRAPIGIASRFGWMFYYHMPVRINGVEAGTALGDEVLSLGSHGWNIGLTQAACEEINRRLTGDPTVLAFTDFDVAPTRQYDWIWQDGTYSGQGLLFGYDLPAADGCFQWNGWSEYVYFRLLRTF